MINQPRLLGPSKRAIDWADRTLECREIDVHPMTWEAAKEIKRLAEYLNVEEVG